MAKAFELGVVMAGAISAGAYTAGVIDFLFEALDDYYAARGAASWDGPRHDVRLPILSGASAGGMTAAIAGLHAFRDLKPAQALAEPPPAASNRLYSSWVEDVSIERLLETTDLNDGAGLRSALCCDVLDEIVRNAFEISGPLKIRPWIGRDGDPVLRLRLTVTNTRGVPYSFKLFGQDAADSFGMLNHADFMEFVVGEPEAIKAAAADGVVGLDAANFAATEWEALRQAALASGAFPVGLRPRLIRREDTRAYFQPSFSRFQPDAAFATVEPYEFVAVDGGAIDNEPLDLARRELIRTGPIHTDGALADKAVLLVAPFPNLSATPAANLDLDLVGVIGALANTMKQQARFKPEELALAASDEDYSRFIISPTRAGNHSEAAEKYPIACGVMGGFGGFLHKSFRRHDYLLGRRNAQAFLRWSFALPANNPLFEGADIAPSWIVRNPRGRTETLAPSVDASLERQDFAPATPGGPPQPGYPIIPLTPRMIEPIVIGAREAPTPDEVSLKLLTKQAHARALAAVGTLVDNDLPRLFPALGGALNAPLKLAARDFGAHVATEWGMKQIEQALQDCAEAFDP